MENIEIVDRLDQEETKSKKEPTFRKEHVSILSKEFNVTPVHSENIIKLIDEGNTIPFIARYRKEMTGGCDDQVLREFADRLEYLRKLDDRKDVVRNSITEQGFMTDEINKALNDAKTLTEVEDIYRPYKPKRKTRATVAIAKGLKPLAELILEQRKDTKDIMKIAEEYIDEEKGVKTAQEAVDGAKDIIAEIISDTAELRKIMRDQLWEHGVVFTTLITNEKTKDKVKTYEMYDNFREPVNKIVSHRILAINRADKEDCLKCIIEINEELPYNLIYQMFVQDAPTSYLVREAGEDAYKRLIKPSIENEVRGELFEMASEQAIKMFDLNLRPLLLQPPVKNRVVLGLDPGYRTGCKIAVVDGNGNVLDKTTVFFTEPHKKVDESKAILKGLIEKYKVGVIAIGNGTASKESEIFIADLIKEIPNKVEYIMVNEAGASVYSASKLASEEFPNLEPAHRSAASIARRLQDPLAELIKIDPKSIGVGQYQHDMPQARLTHVLGGVVEDCVNSVGVDLNTASAALLSFVSGLNASIAKNIITYRASNGGFSSREQLLKVPKLGGKAYEQCAGFLRIADGDNILDNTAVHPESYVAATKLLQLFKLGLEAVAQNKLAMLESTIYNYGIERAAKDVGVGVPTLEDIARELMQPGRDIRDQLPAPMLRSDVMDMNDLKEGMELTGTVRNVIDFGVFVDIGVHQDGLVHISQIVDRYIKHPSEVLSVGDIVNVKVLGVDKERKRISLTMRY
ncbi:MAG: RNA-binding transcriptional accessory protein [Firmicutes bacterium]|nr:RNA-binding transcriptional accessory protein [Bacillota bacterium]